MRNEFKYKKWANSELVEAISKIDQETFSDKYRLALRLLNHTFVADQIFIAHLSGTDHPYSWANTDDTPTLDDLKTNLEESDNWFCSYIESASDAELNRAVSFTFTDGKKGLMSVREILSHILIHGAYHRGNIGMVLGECGIDKPNDIFTRFLHESEPNRRN